jgi:HEAT repeat protein
LERLLLWARNDPAVHPAALRIFRAALADVREPWTALSTARGLDLLAPPDEARRAWLALLAHPLDAVVSSVALSAPHRSYAPVLAGLLETRSDPDLRQSIVRALGRLGDPDALAALVRQLGDGDAQLRGHAIEALRELGDARAIAHLEPLLADTAPAWAEDYHGPMLRVCDLAKDAIASLRRGR